jgi:hypothetical protein
VEQEKDEVKKRLNDYFRLAEDSSTDFQQVYKGTGQGTDVYFVWSTY